MIEGGDRHSQERGNTRGTRGRGAAQRWRHTKGASHTGKTEQGRQEAERGGRCTESGATRREHKREAEGRGRQNRESQVRMRAAQRQQPHPQPVPRPRGNHHCRVPKALPRLRVKDNRLPAPPSPHPPSPPRRLFRDRSPVHRQSGGGEGEEKRRKWAAFQRRRGAGGGAGEPRL